MKFFLIYLVSTDYLDKSKFIVPIDSLLIHELDCSRAWANTEWNLSVDQTNFIYFFFFQ